MHCRALFILPTILYLFTTHPLFSQDTVINKAFKGGEYLKYDVYYSSSLGNFTAGEAILTVENYEEKHDGITQYFYQIIGVGNSKGMFNWFYKVRDKFETYAYRNNLLPYAFVKNTHEGKYIQNDLVIFDREKNEALTNHTEICKIPDDVHDFVSALYFMRTLNVEDFGIDSLYYINFFLDDSVYVSAIKYQGKSEVHTQWGSIICLKIAPMMASGEVFAEKYPMFVYVSDDENHVPILAESKVIVGSIKMELVEYDGLVRPLNIRMKK